MQQVAVGDEIELKQKTKICQRRWDVAPTIVNSLAKSQALTNSWFASVVVTSKPHVQKNKMRNPKYVGMNGAPKPEPRSVYHPCFLSPLVRGHVSGLPKSKSKKLDVVRRHQFFHELLIAERDKYMSALDATRRLHALKEKYSVIKIQKNWRLYARILHWRARSLKKSDSVLFNSVSISAELRAILANDLRCCDWSFSREQLAQRNMHAVDHASYLLQQKSKGRSGRLRGVWNRAAGEVDGGSGDVPSNMMGGFYQNNDSNHQVDQQQYDKSKDGKNSSHKNKQKHSHNNSSKHQRSKKKTSTSETDEMIKVIDSWAQNKVAANSSSATTSTLALRKLEASAEMIEARRLEAEWRKNQEKKKNLPPLQSLSMMEAPGSIASKFPSTLADKVLLKFP